MSVREELFESLMPCGKYPAPGEEESVNNLLDAYRDEVLSEAVRAQKMFFGTTYSQGNDGCWYDMSAWLMNPAEGKP